MSILSVLLRILKSWGYKEDLERESRSFPWLFLCAGKCYALTHVFTSFRSVRNQRSSLPLRSSHNRYPLDIVGPPDVVDLRGSAAQSWARSHDCVTAWEQVPGVYLHAHFACTENFNEFLTHYLETCSHFIGKILLR